MEPIDPKYVTQYYPITDDALREILKPEILSKESNQYIKELVRTANGDWIMITAYDFMSDMPAASND